MELETEGLLESLKLQLETLRDHSSSSIATAALTLQCKKDKLQKLFRKAYFRLAKGPKSERLREVMNKARCLLPKAFFDGINAHTKLKSKGRVMLCF